MTDLYVAKVPDKTILDMLAELKKKYGSSHMAVDLGGVPLGVNEHELIRKKKGPSLLIQSFSFNPDDNIFDVSMNRGNILPSLNPAYYDLIKFNPTIGRINAEKLLEIEEVLRRYLTFPKAGDAKGLAENTLGIIDRETASLAQLHQTMLENAEGLRISYEEDAAKRRKKFEEQQLLADEEIRKREAEALERINAEKAALDEKIKEFDQSDHMFARRKLREDITNQVQEFTKRPLSSRQSASKFWLIAGLCLVASAGAGVLAFESFQSFVSLAQATQAIPGPTAAVLETQRLPQDTYLLWMMALRGAVLSAVCVGFAAYLISLLRKSYDSEVRTLHEFQRYGMDINRASWVIETAMEMTTKEGAALPERWIEGACAGLFQADNKKDAEVSSLAALGAVMGLGPEVTVGPTGASFKIPPKGAKKAANDAE
ncbi:hypothetical protein EFD56_09815 [Rhizobium phaseoli]|uniref:hypothetical protein n=1 Tax=Rhizobium phaseoli TaxID=396 RepID=UPI000F866A3B|nr:hypothetical protein [Rhizobium phaseoli]RUM19934.1 hypothetical protein EFD56_09815 [Rhizobium phaseoli]